VFDGEGKGELSTVELRYILTKFCPSLTENDMDEIIEDADYDGVGVIQYVNRGKIIFKILIYQ
jgi:calmodulin